MERKIGDIFTYNGKTYKVVTYSWSCNNCAFFKNNHCEVDKSIAGECIFFIRNDGKNIIFKEINNMEIKNNQLTIDIPKGMEIDTENSDFTKGIIKFRPKHITYDDIVNSANSIDSISALVQSGNMLKLEAIEQLMNIARYYNKGWKPNWDNSKESKYSINFDNYDSEFFVDNNFTINSGSVYFKNREDAQAVIDNSNFREILDTIYKY